MLSSEYDCVAGQSSQVQPVRYNEPVRFVSSGHMAHDTVELRPALQPLPTASAFSAEQPAPGLLADTVQAEPVPAGPPEAESTESEAGQPSNAAASGV